MSRQFRPGQQTTWEANADLSLLQYTALKLVAGPAGGADARVDSQTGGRCIGVLQNRPKAAGLASQVMVSGFTFAKVDGSGTPIVAGDPLKAGAGGIFVKATANKDPVTLFACAGSTALGDIIEAYIERFDLAV